MIRLGISYDLSPNVNFYLELTRLSGFGGNEPLNPLIALEGATKGLHYNDKAGVT